MLIKKCLCGSSDITYYVWNKIPVGQCVYCQIMHQKLHMTEEKIDEFYKNMYHDEFQHNRHTPDYKERYQHDYDIALKKETATKQYLKGRILDVGAGNGAYVDALHDMGYDSWGLEIASFIDNNRIHKSWDDLITKFDTIVFNDVFEHFVDPIKKLKFLKKRLNKGGHIIIDFPNFWVDEGLHHWKIVEHLWFFTEDDIIDLMSKNGFLHLGTDKPIPSKLVFYFENNIS